MIYTNRLNSFGCKGTCQGMAEALKPNRHHVGLHVGPWTKSWIILAYGKIKAYDFGTSQVARAWPGLNCDLLSPEGDRRSHPSRPGYLYMDYICP